jgi:hypothetical protein
MRNSNSVKSAYQDLLQEIRSGCQKQPTSVTGPVIEVGLFKWTHESRCLPSPHLRTETGPVPKTYRPKNPAIQNVIQNCHDLLFIHASQEYINCSFPIKKLGLSVCILGNTQVFPKSSHQKCFPLLLPLVQ